MAERQITRTRSSGMLAHATQLACCRRDLQEAFGLVLNTAQVSEIVRQNNLSIHSTK